jgi:hypothetical protein
VVPENVVWFYCKPKRGDCVTETIERFINGVRNAAEMERLRGGRDTRGAYSLRYACDRKTADSIKIAVETLMKIAQKNIVGVSTAGQR